MSFVDVLLPEYDRETGTTQHLLECIPEAAFHWKPYGTLTSLGRLAAHLADLPRWINIIMSRRSFNLSAEPVDLKSQVTSTAQLLERFDANVKGARPRLVEAIDGSLSTPWTLKRGTHDVFTMPRIVILRYFILNHLVHHRGQLTVYLQMRDVSIPAIYGPSANETFFS